LQRHGRVPRLIPREKRILPGVNLQAIPAQAVRPRLRVPLPFRIHGAAELRRQARCITRLTHTQRGRSRENQGSVVEDVSAQAGINQAGKSNMKVNEDSREGNKQQKPRPEKTLLPPRKAA
jgi:hypothetical protein